MFDIYFVSNALLHKDNDSIQHGEIYHYIQNTTLSIEEKYFFIFAYYMYSDPYREITNLRKNNISHFTTFGIILIQKHSDIALSL